MSKVYGEPVDVWMRDDRPVRFVWRSRLHTVLRVLEHWVVSRDWWQKEGQQADGPAGQEFWRVEASPARNVTSATYELRRDSATGNWLLARVWD